MAVLDILKELCARDQDAIEHWLQQQRAISAPLVYNSVDLRHARFKLAPVDTNCFPAGFLHLSENARRRASQHLRDYILSRWPQAKRALLVPENHTRNLPYLENLATLQSIALEAGFEAVIGTMQEGDGALELERINGERQTQYRLEKTHGQLRTLQGFEADVILLNNDLTSGLPEYLNDISQPILPSPQLGWWQRRKSHHFREYAKLAGSFAEHFKLDKWLISAEYRHVDALDFKEQSGLDALAHMVEQVLTHTRAKYEQYGITQAPYAYIKAESGTYGMGIMTVQSPDEVFEMNKKARNKMQVIKEGMQVREVMVQEGVPTVDVIQQSPAEPMMYLVDGVPVGGIWRYNPERTAENNLNATGMAFTGMCDEREEDCSREVMQECQFRSFGLISTLAALAAAREEFGESSLRACA